MDLKLASREIGLDSGPVAGGTASESTVLVLLTGSVWVGMRSGSEEFTRDCVYGC